MIQDNYVSELRRRNLEILTLNVQLNPHFLYNTLNTLNWVAAAATCAGVRDDREPLRMLYYTSDNRSEFVREDDLLAPKVHLHHAESL